MIYFDYLVVYFHGDMVSPLLAANDTIQDDLTKNSSHIITGQGESDFFQTLYITPKRLKITHPLPFFFKLRLHFCTRLQ